MLNQRKIRLKVKVAINAEKRPLWRFVVPLCVHCYFNFIQARGPRQSVRRRGTMEAPDLELLLASQVDMSPWLACVYYHGYPVLCLLPWLAWVCYHGYHVLCLLPWLPCVCYQGYHVLCMLLCSAFVTMAWLPCSILCLLPWLPCVCYHSYHILCLLP